MTPEFAVFLLLLTNAATGLIAAYYRWRFGRMQRKVFQSDHVASERFNTIQDLQMQVHTLTQTKGRVR